ncbi:uncharacterized protein [Lepeophtheirus salmonis]|uniref:uncharacterized protein isoform X2 n=1 Tax=Lepeophtheirus salmonis TaxID=72036 RepID=UPI001AEA34CC|nr:serine-rich adhesin for platelets-like isoform X2 [Lepeophtheirus salmonis]
MEGEGLEMDSFLNYFLANHRDDNFSTIRYGNYEIRKQDLEGEILDWTLQYLQYMSCPASLEAGLAKAVLDETKLSYLNEDQPDGGKAVSGKQAFTSLALLQNVTVTVSEVCRRLKKEEKFRKSFMRSKNLYPCSVCAIRNGRKKMEDRHIVIHDVNALFKQQQRSNDDVSTKNRDDSDNRVSFYGVFDGHVGKDASAFAAAHLHQFLLGSEHYPSDPIKATYEAFQKTNSVYEKKSEKEDKALKCGSTVVFTLIMGRKMYISWLGDSQVLLVRNGVPIKVTTPHKPERKDERERISKAGGSVILYGQWRVNGLLAVSRSIGDFEHKSFISAEPDVTSVEMNDTEDFVILASDGLWDYVSHAKVTSAVFEHLVDNAKANGEIEKLSQELANLAKQNGSGDNISVIVIFLKPVQLLIQEQLRRSEAAKEDNNATATTDFAQHYLGIYSTCKYLTHTMSTGEDTLLSTNVKEAGAFSSPGGGGMTFGGNFSPDGNGRINDSDENEEQFRRASDSMFKEGNDFMTNTDNTWIQPSGNNSLNNPFLPDMSVTHKPDSGFISPACNSSNKSSDEDRKEDEEFLESQEVSKLLGGRPMEELLSRNTPTPPVDETGSSLEEILAAARDNPDSVGEVDDDDSDESSADDSKPPPSPLKDNNTNSGNQAANQNISDSDDNDEGDFTFVKEESQSKNLLVDIHSGEGNNIDIHKSPIPSELSNGHKEVITIEEEDGEGGPSSVIIETQEAPNPDSASFILKTTNSEAPQLPSPQEPVFEVIMESEGVGNASSPILEEVEEEDRNSIASPHKDIKESSELECDNIKSGDEVVTGGTVSFQYTDDESNFMLKTPNPSDMLILSEDEEGGPQPVNLSKTEESVNIQSDNYNIENDSKEITNSKDERIENSSDLTGKEKQFENGIMNTTTNDAHVETSTKETDTTSNEPIENDAKKTSDVHVDSSTKEDTSSSDNEPFENDSRERSKEEKNEVMEEVVEEEIIDVHVNRQIGIHSIPPPTIHIQEDEEPSTDNTQLEAENDNSLQKSEDKKLAENQQPQMPEAKNDVIIDEKFTSDDDNVVVSNSEIVDELSGGSNVLKEQDQASSDEAVKVVDLSGGSDAEQELIQIETTKDNEVQEEILKEEPIVKSESTTVAAATSPLVEVSEELIQVTPPKSENLEAPRKETIDNALEAKGTIQIEEVIQNEDDKNTPKKEEDKKAVTPQSKITEVNVSTSPSKTSPKKDVKPPGGAATVKKASTPSNARSATSSPKKTAAGSSLASSVKSTINKRPASSSGKTTTSASKSTPKTTSQTTKPSSASKVTSATRNPMSVPSRVSSTRPLSSARSNHSSALTKKPMSSTTSRSTTSTTTTATTTSRLASSRTSSGDAKSRMDTASKREVGSKVGGPLASSKPSSRLGGTTSKISSSLAASNKSNGTSSTTTTTTTTTTTRRPLAPRSTATSSTLSKSKPSSESVSSKVGGTAKPGSATNRLQGRSATTSHSSTKGGPGGVGLKKPTNISAKVSTGLTRPKSSSLKTAKPTENGASSTTTSNTTTATSSPKVVVLPVNGNAEITITAPPLKEIEP